MSELNFESRLIAAQNELKAPKGQWNDFSKFKYRSAEDVLEAVKPINTKYNLLLTLSDKPIAVGDRIYIEATATLTDAADQTNQIIVTAYAREAISKKGMDDSQITGTASSYARKYALNGLYLIDDTKDADTNEYKTQQDNAPRQQNYNNQYNAQNQGYNQPQQTKMPDNFTQNRIDINERLSVLAQRKNTTTQKLNDWILVKTNKELNRSDTGITKENIKSYNKQLRSLESRARLEETQAEQTSLMNGNTTTPVGGN